MRTPGSFLSLAAAAILAGGVLGPLAGALVAQTASQAMVGRAAPEAGAAGRAHAAAAHAQAVPLAGEIHLDGRLDEAAWARAQPAALATQLDPDEGKAPTERTELRIVTGADALYIGARMFDDQPGRIVSRLGRRDAQPASDRLTVRLDSRHDHLTAFRFDVYPAGNKGDAAIGSDGSEDDSWDPVWDAATSIDSLGWTAEIRIPLSQLRYDPHSAEWGLQVQRFIQRKQEEDVFAYTPKSENEGINRYGHLAGLQGLSAGRRLELTPYVSSHATYAPAEAGDPFRSGHDYAGSAGADLKMGLTRDFTLDATINPDFGQVEVDPAVVNLSAFETFYPEKRPFFVEGADLFTFGSVRTFNGLGTPTTFFSRRIGRQPQGDVDGAAAFSDVPEQTTIAAAAKVTGKTRGGWSVALLDAVTPKETGRYTLAPGDPIQRATVEPLSNYLVGRVRREFAQGNTAVGALVTAVNRDLADSALAGTLRSGAYLGGIDFNHSWGNRNWAFDGFFAGTLLRGSEDAIARAQRTSARYYQRPDAARLDYDPTRTSLAGYASQVAVTKLGGGHWGGNFELGAKSPGYETNDLGFAQVVGRRGVATDIHYQEFRPGPLFRNYIVGFLTTNDWNYDGDKTTSSYGSVQNVRLRNFWSLNMSEFYNFARWDDQLTRGGPLARAPGRWNTNFYLATDERGLVSFTLSNNTARNAAGTWNTSVGLGAVVRPGPSLRLSLEPSYTHAHDLAQYVQAVGDPLATATFGSRRVFGTLDLNELALDTRIDWTFTPKLSLQLYVQPLVSSGAYGDYKEFRAPRTYAFDVYGRDKGTITHDAAARTYTVDPDGEAGPAQPFAIADQNFNFRSLRANVVFRWEYRPGSTIFFVWQQSRESDPGLANFRLGRDLGGIFDGPARNLLAVKVTYWLGL